MSAYPGADSSYSPAPAGDPTAVIGRRIAALVVDVVLFMLLMAFFGPSPLSPFADYYTEDELPSDDCGYVLKLDDVANCFDIGDRFYVTDATETLIQAAVGLAWFLLILGALQGIKGVTPGKALFGVKVVGEGGGPPGVGRALVRSVLWIVDSAPWCLPLVGFVTGLTSKGHRRVGDMVAKTFVVDRSHAGPVVVPGMVAAAGAYGAAPSGGNGPPPVPTPAPGAYEGSAPQAAAPGYDPRWDAARGTYIVWDPNRGGWFAWDQAAQEWKPF